MQTVSGEQRRNRFPQGHCHPPGASRIFSLAEVGTAADAVFSLLLIRPVAYRLRKVLRSHRDRINPPISRKTTDPRKKPLAVPPAGRARTARRKKSLPNCEIYLEKK